MLNSVGRIGQSRYKTFAPQGAKFWTPANLGSALDLWIDPSNTASMAIISDRVQQINDLSGKGNHLAAIDASGRPLYTASDSNVNNMPTIRNTTTTQTLRRLNVPVLRNVAGASAFQIVRYDTGVAYVNNSFSLRVSNGASITSARFGFSSNIVSLVDKLSTGLRRLDGDTFQNTPGSTTKSNVVVLRSTVMNYSIARLNQWTNGSQDITDVPYGTPGNTSDTNSQLISIYYNQVNNITVGESIICNVALPTEDRQKVEGYLAWKWGLVGNLPDNHPYKYDGSLFMWTPALAFKPADNGVWYDPSDFTTLFQNSIGTIPVTAVEQPVGLMLDKSKKLALGLNGVINGDASDELNNWTTLNATCSTSSNTFAVTATSNFGDIRQTLSLSGPKTYLVSFDIISSTSANQGVINITDGLGVIDTPTSSLRFNAGSHSLRVTLNGISLIQMRVATSGDTVVFDNISVREIAGNHAFQLTSTSRPILRARYNLLTDTETLATQSTTTVATTYRLLFSGAGTITLSGTAAGTYTAGTHNITCASGTLTLTVSGTVTQADLRPTSGTLNQPSYQRVTTSTNYDTVGFMPYLQTDGVDDWMRTSNMDLSNSDKITSVIGLTKNTTVTEIIFETSTTQVSNTGTIQLRINHTNTANYMFGSRGSISPVLVVTPNDYLEPITNVVTCIGDISGRRAIIRVNSTQVIQSTNNQGTGNYGNYPLFLFRRGGTTLSFNGRMYGLVIINRLLAPSDLTKLETFINNETKAY